MSISDKMPASALEVLRSEDRRAIQEFTREVGISLWSISSLLDKHLSPEKIKLIMEKLTDPEVNDLTWSLGRVLQCTLDMRERLLKMPGIHTEYHLDICKGDRAEELRKEYLSIRNDHPKFRDHRPYQGRVWRNLCTDFECPHEGCTVRLCFNNTCKEHIHPLKHAIDDGHLITHTRAKERKESYTTI